MNQTHTNAALNRAAREAFPNVRRSLWSWDPAHIDTGFTDTTFPSDYDELARGVAYRTVRGDTAAEITDWLCGVFANDWGTELVANDATKKVASIMKLGR